jgi:Protein of unknown function (DUF1592)/Protein of unknown function (DUF1588)/Protein of unknown function (DUF1587)/Protein of unknown function (DUF1595)/Protein of unknown function (DUF1585)
MKPFSRYTAVLVLFAARGFAESAANAPAAAQGHALVDRYCSVCHNDKLRSGGMTLTELDVTHPDRNPELAEKIISKLQAGMMPPAGMPRPDAATLENFLVSFEGEIDRQAALHPYAGRPALHRLNRSEYANAVHDLLAEDVNVTGMLPPDDMSHGFDNMADVLTVSPALMESYLRAASKISREAVGDPRMAPYVETYHIPRVISQTGHIDGTPFGTRGGLAVTHNFPVDGEYIFKMNFYHSLDGPLFGKSQGKGQQVEVSVDGERVALLDVDPNLILTDELRTPATPIQAGPHRIAAAFLQKAEGPVEDAISAAELSLVDLNVAALPGMTALPHLKDVSVSGPFHVTGVGDTPSRRLIFACRPADPGEEIACAQKILSALARRAWRRPVSDGDLEGLLNFYQSGRNKGDFDSGIQTALQAVLASPEFVFRFEHAPASAAAGTNYRISDVELASRLSFFLWSGPPDEQLLTLAIQKELHNPMVLEKQVRRMLADPRSSAITANFASEWLHLQNLKDSQPDAYLFPRFNRNLANSMRRETEMLFDSIIHEDRDVLDLLTSDYTFVDELLARHYGIPNVLGSRFRRVPVTDPNRRGLLGQASILTLTSISNRTSPVARGKYVMEVLLGTPPPAPPPNVPALKDTGDSAKVMSVRERMEQHRKNEPCKSCHQTMDPIGFALENFDAIGAWRIHDSGFPVDASGRLYDGTKLDGPVSLRQAILNHSAAFLTTFTENLLAYGLGRVVDYRDMPVVRSIVAEAGRSGNRFSSFILGVVKSTPFQMRLAEESQSRPAGVGVNSNRAMRAGASH